ncbi:phospholipase D family protein [Novosphingobium sp. KA1]|uniref:phospholipase D family protein n=1 Tax=Novosphingobium sp. (strain KA1) TaxID=164608 RepID=UPI001A8FA20A|nr:phospholipase D family protein [Novosphingobium sp. KA1]QSR17450.1 hypothetical protein CA833_09685 [Novosphingobium sp. KA1]
MTKFLNDKEVGRVIRKVMAGKDVRCAVAFWGDGALDSLFPSAEAARSASILCDLTMGGTNPHELTRLGAPENARLKHVKGLHAKVYLSDVGLVVASANASNRGIGFVEVAALTECGTFHEPGTQAFNDADDWFGQLWNDPKRAMAVDQEALNKAQRAWARRPRHGMVEQADGQAPNTLLRRIAANPDDIYRGVGVVFTSDAAKEEDRDAAYEAAIAADDQRVERKLSDENRKRLKSWSSEDLYFGWAQKEIDAWPGVFLGVHRDKPGAFSYWCYERFERVRLDNDSAVFGEQSEEFREKLGMGENPTKAGKAEQDLLNKIFDHLDDSAGPVVGSGHMLCESPAHLAMLLAAIDGDA